ncbi:MAG: glycoside hydrolase family 19 protein [Alphaproteobacteria bacterium]|nr:glycoside hydrolase family 19 protein [Alphaproteobacteria bacterium]
MTGEVYVVAASGLNMRELPDGGAEVLIVLPRGQFVTRLDNRNWGNGWFRVQADLHMMTFQGYVAATHIQPVNAPVTPGRGDLRVTEADIIKLAKNPKREFLPGLVAGFQRELPRYEINTGIRISHFMAQCAHECDNFRTMQEYASGDAYEGRATLGNTQPGDGRRYKGRGIIQLTGRANYRTYGQALGLDLENNPELAAIPENAVRVACEYWKRTTRSNVTMNQLADRDDINSITRRINGGLNGLADRQVKLGIAKGIWGGTAGV